MNNHEHSDPIPGCKIQNVNTCLNDGICKSGGICSCKPGYVGDRCEQTKCHPSMALHKTTKRCIDVDQFILKGKVQYSLVILIFNKMY